MCESGSFLDSFSCSSNIGSDTSSVGIGWTPGHVGYVPGIPMQNTTFFTSKHHTSTESHVFLTTLDYYGNIYPLDQTTSCVLLRKCSGGNAQGQRQGATYDRSTGLCVGYESDGKNKEDFLSSYPMYLTGNEAVSVRGRIQFKDLIVRATPQPNYTYGISFDCRVYDEREDYDSDSSDNNNNATEGGEGGEGEGEDGTIVLTPSINDVLRVENCLGGTQLTSGLSCQSCIPGRFSHDGKGCTECPTGAECSVIVSTSSTQVATVGEDIPQLLAGYWMEETPPSWTAQECNPEVISAWETNTCPPGEKLSGGGDNDTAATCIDAGWDKDRVHRCRTHLHVYECPSKLACMNRSLNIAEYIVPQGSTSGDYIHVKVKDNTTKLFQIPPGANVGDKIKQEYGNQSKVCMIGYEGPKCGVCERNYTKDGANKCNRCAGGDLVASQAIYGSAITLILFGAIFLIVIYLRDDGFQCFNKGKWIWRKLLLYCCCKCCDKCCCKLCRRLSEAEHVFEARRKLQRQTMLHSQTFFDKAKSKNTNASELNQYLEEHDHDDTIWFRPEKFKIILSFLQVFQEYRRTYRIKWPQIVQDYMDFFSSLVDFDIFRLVR